MSAPKITVTVQQPSLAKYRIPVFRGLASQPRINLKVLYGERKGISNATPDGFEAALVPMKMMQVGRQKFFLHGAQWSAASRGSGNHVIFLTWNTRFLTLVPAILRARLNGIKSVLWGHGYSKNESQGRSSVRRTVAKLADAVLFYDEYTRANYRSAGWTRPNLFVAPNSLDQTDIQESRSYWTSTPDELKDFKQRNQLTERKVILFVSRLHASNRLDLLISACGQLRARDPNVKVVIIGKGDAEKQNLKQQIRDKGLEELVVFVDAIYDEHELAPWFLSSHVFCYPANIGLSALHALSYGLPVVTADDITHQNPEVHAIHDGTNGWFFKAGCVDSLVDKLSATLSNASQLKSRDEIRRCVSATYNTTQMVEGFKNAIDYVTSK